MEHIILFWLITIFLGLWITYKNNKDLIELNKVDYQTLSVYEANSNFIEYVSCTTTIMIFIGILVWMKC